MTVWEYLIANAEAADLDKLGGEGWELVSVRYRSWANERKGYTEDDTTLYFKRPYEPSIEDFAVEP